MNKIVTIPNALTLLRMLCVPGIVWYIVAGNWPAVSFLFTLAALTDIADGWLARWLKQETELGAYLDPVADKLLFISCYTALVYSKSPFAYVPVWFWYVMVIKEILLAAGAFYLGIIRKSHSIRPTRWGKLTTLVQTCFLWALCLLALLHITSQRAINLFLILIISLAVISFIDYAIRAFTGGSNYAKLS